MPQGPFGFPRLTNLGPYVVEDEVIRIVENKLSQVATVTESQYIEGGIGSDDRFVTDFILNIEPSRELASSVIYEEDGIVERVVLRFPVFRGNSSVYTTRMESVLSDSGPPVDMHVEAVIRGEYISPHVVTEDEESDIDIIAEWIGRITREFKSTFDEQVLVDEDDMVF